MVEKKASDNYRAMVSARLAAKTALSHAISDIQNLDADIPIFHVVSLDTARIMTNGERRSLEAKLKTTIDGICYYPPGD